MKKTILFFIISAANISLGYAQDLRFTQSYAAPLRLNPALMGPNNDLKAILNYKRQWDKIQNGFITYKFTFLYPLLIEEHSKLDLGLSAFKDDVGAFSTLDIAVAASYGLRLSESGHYLSGALTAGVIQQTINASQLSFDDQYVLGSYDAKNPSYDGVSKEKAMYPDVGGGVLWYFTPSESKTNAFAGVSVFHQNRPNIAYTPGNPSPMQQKFMFHGGVQRSAGEKIEFLPTMIYTAQGGAEESALGLYTGYNLNESMKLALALWYRYRNKDAVAVTLGFEHKIFVFAYSYDMASFAMNKAIAGQLTHEVTLAYKMNRTDKKGLGKTVTPFYSF